MQCSRETPALESLSRPSSLQFYQKETPTLIFSCGYLEISKNTYFEEYLRTTAYLMKKNRRSWILNNSRKKNSNQWKSMNLQFCKMTCFQQKIQRKCFQSNQMSGGKLSRLLMKKLNFHMLSYCEICRCWTGWNFILAIRDHAIRT